MKKMLLLGAVLGFGLAVSAQQRDLTKVYQAQVRPVDHAYFNDMQTTTNSKTESFGGLTNRSADIFKTEISSSANVYGIFSLEQVNITTAPELDMVVFGNRAGGPMGATGNDIRVAYSTDLGTSWTNFVVPTSNAKGMRYPSTAFYNPQGNTDPANMYAVVTGPYTGAAGWEGQFFGSVKFGGTEDYAITFEPNEPGIYINHMNIGLTVTPDGYAHVASQRLNGTEASYTSVGYEVLNGRFNETTNTFDWDDRIAIETELGDDNRIDANSFVFSADGSVGYLVGTGVDLDQSYNPYGLEWPVVYKTTDHGVTWEKTEPFDFSTIGIFNEMLYPTLADLELVVPRWYNKWVGGNRNNGATVDQNGNLHIAGIIRSTNSVHPDSLNYFYTEEPVLMFDVFMNGDGTWDAQFIDTIRTEPVDDTNPFGMGWDQRIQMSRTDDGSKVFVAWADTDPLLWGEEVTTNLLPDIYVWGYDMNTHKYSYAINKTSMGDFWGDNFWLHLGDKVLESGSDYILPMTTSAASISGGTQDDPLTHSFVGNIALNEADFVIQEVSTVSVVSNATVSQNYPNPVSKVTKVNVTLAKSANVSIEVYNMMGQRVSIMPSRSLSAGVHTLDINVNNLKAGIYTYSVIANGERVSRKMTVK